MTGGRRNLVTLLQLAEANEADQTRRPSSNPARKALVAENHAGSQCSFKPLVTSSAILADEGDFGTRAGVEVRYLGRSVLVQMPADRLFVHLCAATPGILVLFFLSRSTAQQRPSNMM